jgi:rhodanese-related sulfurtransferase
VRSRFAAAAATQAGYADCYNILEGFEGDKDDAGHRGNVGGWKFAGLPWKQG